MISKVKFCNYGINFGGEKYIMASLFMRKINTVVVKLSLSGGPKVLTR
jgi:hypothetical protein